MNFITILLLAIGLSMDAFAVSISCGISATAHTARQALKAGLAFGSFQGGMTALGWLLGASFKQYIEPVDHIIALILLSYIGIKMIREGLQPNHTPLQLTSLKMLLTLSIATSIDALAAGISLSALNVAIAQPALLIGCTTFIFSYTGVFIGKSLGGRSQLEGRMDLLGGLILIGIGLKIFIEHVWG